MTYKQILAVAVLGLGATLGTGTGVAYAQGGGSTGGGSPPYGHRAVGEGARTPSIEYLGSGLDQNGVRRGSSAAGVEKGPGTLRGDEGTNRVPPTTVATARHQDRSAETGG